MSNRSKYYRQKPKVSPPEIELRKILHKVYPTAFRINNYRPKWLRSSATGHKLELDIAFPKLNIAYEYNGQEYHNSDKQKQRDYEKYLLCQDRGYQLVIVDKFRLKRMKQYFHI